MAVIPRLTGEQVLALRSSRNLTQTDFGKIFGVSRRAVAAWESDTWRPPADLLARFTDSAVGNAKEKAKMDALTRTTLEAYREMRQDFDHSFIVKEWFERGFTPSMEAQAAILEEFPDIRKPNK